MVEQISEETLDAQWHRCRRDVRTLLILELVQSEMAVGILVVVAVCGILATTHSAVASGAVALPLGLGLAVTLALAFHVLAWRARIGRELSREDLFRLECARRNAAERANQGDVSHPYRTSPLPTQRSCAYCISSRRA